MRERETKQPQEEDSPLVVQDEKTDVVNAVPADRQLVSGGPAHSPSSVESGPGPAPFPLRETVATGLITAWITILVSDRKFDWVSTLLFFVAAAAAYFGTPAIGRLRLADRCRNLRLPRSHFVATRGYRIAAAVSGVILGVLFALAPTWAFLLTAVAVLVTLYGGQQIGRYQAREEIRAATERVTLELESPGGHDVDGGDAENPDQPEPHVANDGADPA